MELDFKKTFEITFDFISNFTKIISDFSEAEKLKTLEFYIVLYIGIKGPQKMTLLAEHFSTTKSNITNIIDNLERNNYVRRIRSKEDRRIILIELTEKGKKVYREALKNFEIMFNDFMSKASKEDLEVISDGFYRIINIYLRGD
ncbi:MarR family winged helix-turn-helix transcriptional regulator [Marinitoga litoralis]|uniref:MarR family winged helix-turn-helix transcriptional regulator n=1 Tax=Marinitoga litoralis TaxID=570855 RepID=UPI0019619416|nr:MarR family transcriptional regulator [Marinitoga litoralis]MBM7559704.1 DNA-binding MarR family transcriptional regulator [Marinitoga litoralis]